MSSDIVSISLPSTSKGSTSLCPAIKSPLVSRSAPSKLLLGAVLYHEAASTGTRTNYLVRARPPSATWCRSTNRILQRLPSEHPGRLLSPFKDYLLKDQLRLTILDTRQPPCTNRLIHASFSKTPSVTPLSYAGNYDFPPPEAEYRKEPCDDKSATEPHRAYT